MAEYEIDLTGNGDAVVRKKKKKKKAEYEIDLTGNGDAVVRKKQTKKESNTTKGGNKDSYFKSGGFSDGVDGVGDFFGDLGQTVLGTAGDIITGLGKGADRAVEGVGNLVTYGVAGAADLLGDEKTAKLLRNSAQHSRTDEAWSETENLVDQYSVLGNESDALVETLGQVATNILVGNIAGAAGLTSKGVNAVTHGFIGASTMGSGMSEAYMGGATDEEALSYGMIAGAGEVISGLLFGGLGKMSGALGFSKGILSADDAIAKKLSSKVSNRIAKNFVEYGIKAGAEGTEELISGIIQAVGKNVTYMSEEDLGKIIKDENLLDQFIAGAVTSGIVQSGYIPGTKSGSLREANATGRDFITGNTKNEQAVIDKEVESRIKEKEADGEKITAKVRTEIEEQVQKELEKGYISTDTIESTLGGQTYESYKSLKEQEDSLKKEIETLENMPREKITVKQGERLQEARKQLEALDVTSVKNQLSDEVSKLVTSERLSESYNEKARRSQAFEADLTRYDERQRAIVQKAIDSGILNNTNRTHEFVDMIAKISADKGVSFDFTNNQKLKDSGFALEGKTVNGYVQDGNITLNVNSAKTLNKVVGHEITHVLEGTELYSELQDAIIEYAKSKGDYDARWENIVHLYRNQFQGQANEARLAQYKAELTADLVGDYLFSDEQFINNLSAKQPNIFKKIYEEIKYLVKTVAPGSKEAKQMEKVKRAFDKAYKESVNTETDTNIKYHISEKFAEEIEKTLNGEINESGQVKARDFTPEYMVKHGAENLPMLITRNHIKSIIYTKEEAAKLGLSTKKGINYHGLGKDLLIKAIDNMDSPSAVFKKDDDNFIIISEIADNEGNTIIIPVRINGKGLYNNVYIDENHITSVYGKKNLQDYLKRNNFKEIDIEEGTALNEGVQYSNISDSFLNSISQNEEKSSEKKQFSFSEDNHKQKQLDIVLKANPVENTYSTWIRTTEDILTFEEALNSDDYIDYKGEDFDESYPYSIAEEALETGKITVYSSYPIEQGIFVTPSYMEAQMYAGNGKVYSKVVELTDVAWIDPTQGQYAKISKTEEKSSGLKKNSLSDKNDIAPTGTYNIYGSDIELEIPIRDDVAPVQQSAAVDDLPIREDIPTQNTNLPDDLPIRSDLEPEMSKSIEEQRELALEKLGDKESYTRDKANELLNELKNLDKGKKASEELGYLLDMGYPWKELKQALANVRGRPGSIVDKNSGIESIVREAIGRDYERQRDNILYKDLDESIKPKEKITTVKERNAQILDNHKIELQNNIKLREQIHDEYNRKIAELQAKYEAEGDKTSMEAAGILQQIEKKKRMRDDNDAKYEKHISDIEARIKKMNTEKFKRAEQRMTKEQERQTWIRKLIGDTSTWNDKSLGLSYRINTMRRNLRDIVRGADGKRDIAKADAIYDAMPGRYNHQEAQLNKEENEIKSPIAELDINKYESAYVQMLGEYRDNPDTTISAETMQKYYDKHKEKIDTDKVEKAIQIARKVYDELFNRVNKVLVENGFKPLAYREGYFPHFKKQQQGTMSKLLNWKVQDNTIPTDIAGLTEMFQPERSWQSFDKHRRGDKTDYDFLTGFDTYVHGALDWIYHIEDIQNLRALEREIRYQHSEKGVQEQIDAVLANEEYDADMVQNELDKIYEEDDEKRQQIDQIINVAKNPLNNFVQELRRYTNNLAGKKDSSDRGTESATNRKIYSVMTNISNRVSANMVAGSLSSALTNFIPITQSWGEVSPISTLKAMKETVSSIIRDDGMIDKSDFMTNRLRPAENLNKTAWDKIGEKVGFFMEAVDSFTTQTVWRSKYNENIKNGMSESEAIKNADYFAEGLMAGRSRGNMPTAFNAKNPMTKLLTAFQLEVANQYGYMFKDMPQNVGENAKGKLVKGYLEMFVGAYFYNILYSNLTGRDAALDPIGMILEFLDDLFGDDEEEGDALKAIEGLGMNVAQEVPFVGGLLGGGRVPISNALPFDGSFSDLMSAVGEGDFSKIFKEMMNPLYYMAMPMGGGQLRKTVQGLSMFDDDLPTAGSYTDSGSMRFPIEDNLTNRLRSGLFGQWANKNAQDYIENERTPLEEKQIQEYIDVDIPIADYWKYRDGLKEQDTLEEKFDYVAGLDLPVEKKNILINNIVDRKEKVDMKDYDKFADFEEFDFATKNPEKYDFLQNNNIPYTEYKASEASKKAYSWAYNNPEKYIVSKAVTDDIVKYRIYAKEISAIKADKDKDGNAISGSAKNKVIQHLNTLDIDYGAKLILFKEKYNADDTYNYEIVEYLNNRDDISRQEMEIILKELGFTVDAEGNITW